MARIKKANENGSFPKKYYDVLKTSQTMQDLDAMDEDGLRNSIVESENVLEQTAREIEANPDISKLKEDLKALTEGYREVKKFQTAKIKYALHVLEQKGKI